MKSLRWFRVETDDAGKVVSVQAVEAPRRGSVRVHYLCALDEEQAGQLASEIAKATGKAVA